jgi:hypothetical protein
MLGTANFELRSVNRDTDKLPAVFLRFPLRNRTFFYVRHVTTLTNLSLAVPNIKLLSLTERMSDIADEPSSQRLSLNRSQYGDCSSKYNTPAGT